MSFPKRIQRKRTSGWRMPENTVSVCRPGKYGNPLKLVGDMSKENKAFDKHENGSDFIDDVIKSGNRATTIEWFKSFPFVKARALAVNETGRFIRNPFTQLTGREIQNI